MTQDQVTVDAEVVHVVLQRDDGLARRLLAGCPKARHPKIILGLRLVFETPDLATPMDRIFS